MSENNSESPVGIDFEPWLGEILNKFEAMLYSNAQVTMCLVDLVEAKNIMTDEIRHAADAMIKDYNTYFEFKGMITEETKKK